MSTPVTIALKSTGAQAVVADLQTVAQRLNDDARAATHLAQSLQLAARHGDAAAKSQLKGAQTTALALRQQAADARAAAKAADDGARRAAQAQRDLAKNARNAGDAFVDAMNRSDKATQRLIGRLHQAGGALKSASSSQSFQQLGETRDAGAQIGLAGAAGLALAGKTALDAGAYNKIRGSFATALGEEQADAFMEEIRRSDYAKVFGTRAALENAASQLTVGGFSREDLLNSQGTGLYQTVGAMAAMNPNANPEGVREAMRQIGQVKRKTQAEKNDLDVIAESGGIDVYGLVREKFGQERLTEVLKGEKPLTYTELKEALDSIPQFKGGMYKDSLGKAANSLPGQIETLNGALFTLSQTVGQRVVPVVSFFATAATMLAESVQAVPEPILTVIVILGLLMAAGLTMAGALMVLLALYGQATIAMGFLQSSLLASTLAANGATVSFGMLALAILASLAVIGVAVAGFITTARNMEAASAQSSEELKKHYGGLGKFWMAAGELLNRVMSHPIFRILVSGALVNFEKDFQTTGQKEGDAALRKSYEDDKARRKAKGEREITFEEFQSGSHVGAKDFDKETTNNAPNSATPATPDLNSLVAQNNKQLEQLRTQMQTAAPSNMGAALMTSAPSTPDISGDNSLTSTGGGDIRSLEYAAANGMKEGTGKQLRLARLNEKYRKQAEREAKARQREGLPDEVLSALGNTNAQADADNIEALKEELETARLRKDQFQIQFLRARIEEANDVLRERREQDSEAKSVQAQAARLQSEAHRRQIRDLRRQMARTKDKGQKAALQAQIDQLDDAFRDRRLGGSLGGASGLNNVTVTLGSATSASAQQTSPYDAYAAQMMRGMTGNDAALFMARMSAGHRTNANELHAGGGDWRQVDFTHANSRIEGFRDLDEEGAFMRAYQARYGGGFGGGISYRGYSGAGSATANTGTSGNSAGAAGNDLNLPIEIQPELDISIANGQITVEWKGGKTSVPLKDVARGMGAVTRSDIGKMKRSGR